METPIVPNRLSSISAVFPAYNDGGTIPSMILTALIALREVSDDFEIIVTDDGSTDYTGQILDEMAARFPELHVIHHTVNQGYGAALSSGFYAAAKDWVFYTDGDAQYDPRELVELVKALRADVDVVNGYKISRSDPLIRKIVGRLYHWFISFVFGIRLRDVDCDFRLIRRKIFNEIQLESRSGAICVEMIKKIQDLGYAFAETPVHHYFRQYGKSQFFNWPRLARVARRLFILFWKLVVRKEHLKAAKT